MSPAPNIQPPVVVADTPEAFDRLQQSVTAPFRFVAAPTYASARQLIQPDTALVVCGCHFDDGHMYDLLRFMKARPELKDIPFLAIRILEGELDDTIYESVKIATRALGANGFIDLFRLQRQHGEAEANHRLTQRILALAGSGADTN